MVAPTANDLSAFTGQAIDAGQADAVISVVTALASAYTRGRGFVAGEPNNDIRAAILTASARLLSDTSQVKSGEQMGPFQVQYRAGFDGWSTAELATLNRYRERAR